MIKQWRCNSLRNRSSSHRVFGAQHYEWQWLEYRRQSLLIWDGPLGAMLLTLVLLEPNIQFQACFRSIEISLHLKKGVFDRCLVNKIVHFWRCLVFTNINIFRHLKLRSKQFSSTRIKRCVLCSLAMPRNGTSAQRKKHHYSLWSKSL